jgi:hypothetical protein
MSSSETKKTCMEAWLGKQSYELYNIYVRVPVTATCAESRFSVRYVPNSVAYSPIENYLAALEA